MKIRTGFVSNSSSSSFIIRKTNETENAMLIFMRIAGDKNRFEELSEYLYEIDIEDYEGHWQINLDHAGSSDYQSKDSLDRIFGMENILELYPW